MTTPRKNLSHAVIDIAYVASVISDVQTVLTLDTSPLKGASYDGAHTSRSGISDPTAAAALAPNRTRHDLNQLNTLTQRIRDDAAALALICTNHRPGNPETLQRNLAKLAGQGDPGCDLHQSVGSWTAIHRTGTVNGVLKESRKLCRPCYEFVLRNGRPPSKKELQTEKRTGKLKPIVPAKNAVRVQQKKTAGQHANA